MAVLATYPAAGIYTIDLINLAEVALAGKIPALHQTNG